MGATPKGGLRADARPGGKDLLGKNHEAASISEGQRKKAPKGNSECPWSLHIRSFWKTHFINPPEVHGQVVRLLIYG
jgi:hypothetical protein